MFAKSLGKLLTGRLAFLVGGVVDAVLYGLVPLRRKLAGTARRLGRASTIRQR